MYGLNPDRHQPDIFLYYKIPYKIAHFHSIPSFPSKPFSGALAELAANESLKSPDISNCNRTIKYDVAAATT